MLNMNILKNSSFKRLIIRTSNISTTSISCNSNDDQQDAKQKLQTLLNKLAQENMIETKDTKIARPIKRVVEKRPTYKIKLNKIDDQLQRKMVCAVKEVADEVGGDIQQTESELLHVVLNNKTDDKVQAGDLKDIISRMKVEKEETRAEQIRKVLPKRTIPLRIRTPAADKVQLFGGNKLNIFSKEATNTGVPLDTWEQLEQKELRMLVTHPPSNIYEEMILWTKQGKLWKFPIDNEQGLDDEKQVDFSEHVFLDKHLHPWCPSRGPIRHFMELVLVGLSKNPYITVQAKIDHINWFRDYFEEKRNLLEAVGAVDTKLDNSPKQLSNN